MIIRIHRFLGVTLVLFVLILSVTGTLLQHADDFNIRQKYTSSEFAKNFYNIEPCKVLSVNVGSKWFSKCNNNLYFQDIKIVNNVNSISSINVDNNFFIIQYGNHRLKIDRNGKILDMEHLKDEEVQNENNLQLKENEINDKLRKKIENKSISKTITYERVIVDIHTGRIFGQTGVTLIDLVTIGIIFLSITGTITWIKQKKFF